MAWNDTKEDYNGSNPDESLISASDWNNMTTNQQSKADSSTLTAHTNDSSIHFATSTITSSTISDFDTAVSANSDVIANSAKISFDTTSSSRLANTSGTNTGDETSTSIKTKLGITTLSGSNTGDQDLSSYALKNNVLELDNTTSFTPSGDYEPSTKKYVDDSITLAGGYTDEQAQDAVGGILTDSSEIDFTYNDATPSITASIISGSIDVLKLDSGVQTSLGLADSAVQTETDPVYSAWDKSTGISIAASQVSDFDTEVANNSAVSANTSKTGVTTQISNVSEDTTPQLGGNLSWNSKGMILEGISPSGLSTGNLAMFNGTNWVQSDASAESSAKGMLGVYSATNTILTHGIYTPAGGGLTAGAIYYMSETAGAITTTAPSTSGAIVRIIGYALSTTELFVDPDKTYIEVS